MQDVQYITVNGKNTNKKRKPDISPPPSKVLPNR